MKKRKKIHTLKGKVIYQNNNTKLIKLTGSWENNKQALIDLLFPEDSNE